MTGPSIKKAPRKRYPSDDRDSDRRLRPTRHFGDVGPAIAEADYKPRTLWSRYTPEQAMAAAFMEMGCRDFGGAADAAELRAMIGAKA